MKKHLTVIYCCVIGLLFVLTVGFFSYNLISEYNHGELRTQLRFEKLVTGIKQSAEKNSLNSKDFYNKVIALSEPQEDFMYLKINIDNNVFYSIPSEPEQLESTISYAKENSKMLNFYTRVFNIKDTTFEITAGLYSLRPSVIYSHLRAAFLVILIATIITVIVIIYINCINKNNDQVIEIYEDSNTESQSFDETTNEYEPVVFDENVIEEDEITIENTISEEETDNISEDFTEEQTDVSEPSGEIDEESKENIEQVQLPVEDTVPVDMSLKSPEGLFNPETGLGWEQYLETRLNNELNRATSSEIDLALFEIKLPNVSRTETIMKNIADYLIEEFQFKDLLFEYKTDSIIAIKISMNIDEALILSEKLEEKINSILSVIDEKCYIGITSRTIRMVNAERILKEADEAVAHAIDDSESNIIAFRADAVKYREYLESK